MLRPALRVGLISAFGTPPRERWAGADVSNRPKADLLLAGRHWPKAFLPHRNFRCQ